MKNITKLNSTYTYPARGKGDPAIEVGFFLDSRLDRFGNILRKVNITDIYGQIHNVDYYGKSLMLSVKTGARTTSVRRAKREDFEKYKEAYNSYLSELTLEDKKLHENSIYLFLEELPPVDAKVDAKNDELEKTKAEIEVLKKELSNKTKKSKKVEISEELNTQEETPKEE